MNKYVYITVGILVAVAIFLLGIAIFYKPTIQLEQAAGNGLPPRTETAPVIERIEVGNGTSLPEKHVISKGTTVILVNAYHLPQTLQITPIGYSSKVLSPGETAEYTFDQAGNFTYSALDRPEVKGDIIVLP